MKSKMCCMTAPLELLRLRSSKVFGPVSPELLLIQKPPDPQKRSTKLISQAPPPSLGTYRASPGSFSGNSPDLLCERDNQILINFATFLRKSLKPRLGFIFSTEVEWKINGVSHGRHVLACISRRRPRERTATCVSGGPLSRSAPEWELYERAYFGRRETRSALSNGATSAPTLQPSAIARRMTVMRLGSITPSSMALTCV